MINFLTRDALTFHAQLNADKGIRDIGLIESAINAPFQSFGGRSLYPTIFDKAARLFFGLAMNHGFIDGNKRVALQTALVYLRINNLQITASDDQLFNVTMRLANGELSAEQLKFWLVANSTPAASIFRQGSITIKT